MPTWRAQCNIDTCSPIMEASTLPESSKEAHSSITVKPEPSEPSHDAKAALEITTKSQDEETGSHEIGQTDAAYSKQSVWFMILYSGLAVGSDG